MVTTKLNLSMTEPSVRQIYAKQGDTGRVLDITLDQTPEDGTLRILRPDGVEVTSDAVTGGEVESGSSFESLTEADVTELTADIEPIQDLNGYDKPWVGGAGKNLYNASAIGLSSNGVTATVSNGTITLNGTATANAFFSIHNTGHANQQYTYSFNNPVANSGVHVSFRDTNGNYFNDVRADAVNKVTTFTNEPSSILLYVTSGTTLSNFVVKPQLELGSTATAWQPYSNICPITGHDEVTVTQTGKNKYPILIGEDRFENNASATHTNDGGTLKIEMTATVGNGVYGNYTLSAITPLSASLPQGSYTISFDAMSSVEGGCRIGYESLSSNIFNLTTDWQHYSLTANLTGVKRAFIIYNTIATARTVYVKNLQVEQGSTATAYEPYQGSTYTTSLGQTVYGGTLDMVTGQLVVDRGLYTVTNVSQILGNGSKVGTYPKWLLALNNIPNVDPSYYNEQWSAQDAVICNMGSMVRESVSLNTNETTMSVYFHATMMEIRLRPLESDFPTLEEAKQAYVGAEFAYPVTPTTYQLTPQQIKTLIGTNNVWASSGDVVSIKFTYGGLLSELPSDATSVVGKCYCDVEQNGVSSMPFTLNVKKNERES